MASFCYDENNTANVGKEKQAMTNQLHEKNWPWYIAFYATGISVILTVSLAATGSAIVAGIAGFLTGTVIFKMRSVVKTAIAVSFLSIVAISYYASNHWMTLSWIVGFMAVPLAKHFRTHKTNNHRKEE